MPAPGETVARRLARVAVTVVQAIIQSIPMKPPDEPVYFSFR